ncbi:MAG: hypothetical protein EBR82_43920 [Caulobacteraceae bacterium]|nr:hypothetical protein [Caulobacteraceae bacterium]
MPADLFFGLLGTIAFPVVLVIGILLGALTQRHFGGSSRAEEHDEADTPPAPRSNVQPLALTEPELRAALRVGEDEPWWRAILQCIQRQRAMADALAVSVDSHLRGTAVYYSGAVEHLDELQTFLMEQRLQALREVEEEE